MIRNLEQYKRHGGPYDRGSADAYYGREIDPHCFLGDTHQSKRIELEEGTDEHKAHILGYESTPFNQKNRG